MGIKESIKKWFFGGVRMNEAQLCYAAMGVDSMTIAACQAGTPKRNSSYTKKGPGRYHQRLSRAQLKAKEDAAS